VTETCKSITPENHLAHCLDRCRQNNLRRTRVLNWLLREMIAAINPLTLTQLQERAEAGGLDCDPATLYRQIMKLEGIGLVRRLGFHQRSNYFKLLLPGQHQDYLICDQCGAVQVIDIECPVHDLEDEVVEKSGFTGVHHELEFFGVCPDCQQAEKSIAAR